MTTDQNKPSLLQRIGSFLAELCSADPTSCPYCTGLRQTKKNATCQRCADER